MSGDFYIGYLPKAPVPLRLFVRKVVFGLAVLAVAAACVFVFAQHPFASSTFEFGQVRDFDGIIQTQPYPTLSVARPGAGNSFSKYLLVAPGKHGANALVASVAGQHVHLQGQLIYREGGTLIEVEPGSIRWAGGTVAQEQQIQNLGPVTLAGEIVDSKCYLGVMNPGSGKVHRDCAARCLSGGIPPIFVTADGRGEIFLLVDLRGQAVGYDALREFVAEPVTVQGELLQEGDRRFLQIDPKALRHR